MNDIWYGLQDHERYVYHYTSSSTLADYILPTGKLRFSRFEIVNDPRESKEWIFSYFTQIGLELGPEATDPIGTELQKALKHLWRVGCFASDPYEALVTKQREDQGEDIIGAIYERGHSRPRMWAQYAENYQGACLVFDKEQLDSEIRATATAQGLKVQSGLVDYRNPQVLPKLGKPDALVIFLDEVQRLGFNRFVDVHVERWWKDLFLVKPLDWEQEREFRWLVSGSDDDFFVDIRKSLVGIVMGDRFPDGCKPAVGDFAQANDVSPAIMDWQNGVPQPKPTHWRLLQVSRPASHSRARRMISWLRGFVLGRD